MSGGKLYVTYSTKLRAGTGVGRSVIRTSFAPRTLSFADVQAIEKSLTELGMENLFLTSWQWLANDQEDSE